MLPPSGDLLWRRFPVLISAEGKDRHIEGGFGSKAIGLYGFEIGLKGGVDIARQLRIEESVGDVEVLLQSGKEGFLI
ncbi:MAG: hypothetical protein AAGD01_08255 [Acidobacteriota bacterium]